MCVFLKKALGTRIPGFLGRKMEFGRIKDCIKETGDLGLLGFLGGEI